MNGDGEPKTALFCVIPDSDKSVSYTHLDVYKRQHLSSRDDLEKAAVTVAEGIKDYSTGKRGR